MKKTIIVVSTIITVAIFLWILWSFLVVNNLEEPQFNIIKKMNWYETRQYSDYIVAEVEVTWDQNTALNTGFRLLAGYIFLWNSRNDSIAMTVPVSEQVKEWEQISMTTPVSNTIWENGKRIIQFSMPSKYTLEDLPTPNNSRVSLKKIPWYKAAVLRYSWYASEQKVEKMKDTLLTLLSQDKQEMISEAVSAQYNPPLSFPLTRRNEIIIRIK